MRYQWDNNEFWDKYCSRPANNNSGLSCGQALASIVSIALGAEKIWWGMQRVVVFRNVLSCLEYSIHPGTNLTGN